uniref:Uncharacterized protein n=1 Tax=Salix viminalis TaxID=40686 RepID=A0A6N2LMC4_SALVM
MIIMRDDKLLSGIGEFHLRQDEEDIMRYGEGTSHPRQHVPDLKPKCGSCTFIFFHQHKLDNSPESMDQHQIDHQLIIPSTVSCALTFNG